MKQFIQCFSVIWRKENLLKNKVFDEVEDLNKLPFSVVSVKARRRLQSHLLPCFACLLFFCRLYKPTFTSRSNCSKKAHQFRIHLPPYPILTLFLAKMYRVPYTSISISRNFDVKSMFFIMCYTVLADPIQGPRIIRPFIFIVAVLSTATIEYSYPTVCVCVCVSVCVCACVHDNSKNNGSIYLKLQHNAVVAKSIGPADRLGRKGPIKVIFFWTERPSMVGKCFHRHNSRGCTDKRV